MMTSGTAIREAVATFDSREAVENAIEDLQSNGFDRPQLSLLARSDIVEQKLRQPVSDVHTLEDDPRAPRSEPLDRSDVGNVMGVAVGAPAAFAALAAAGVTALTGGVAALGGLLAKSLNAEVAADFQQQVERGGILLWVALRGPEQEARAQAILRRHATGDIHIHEIPS